MKGMSWNERRNMRKAAEQEEALARSKRRMLEQEATRLIKEADMREKHIVESKTTEG